MYHVINRGNYRADIFASPGAKAAFEACLFEACAKTQWRLHAFIIMRNHYHLALETPRGNLVEGMRWLQSTYANRFNRFRRESGHVFQGRYQAILVEDLATLGAVGHYIHLNPVRAKFLSVENLSRYRHSSYRYLQRPKSRPAGLQFEAVLKAAGGLADTKAGWKSYTAYLEWLACNEPAQKGLAFEQLCRGWALGSREFKRGLLADHHAKLTGSSVEAEVGAEARELHWQTILEANLRRMGKNLTQAGEDPKSAPWKIALATHLRTTTTVSNPWLAQTLHMGASGVLSRYVAECRKGLRQEAKKCLDKISKG